MAGYQSALVGAMQSQAMSHAKFVFLIALVIFFVVLFVAAYVWMRRPDFGQKSGRRPVPTMSGTPARGASPEAPGEQRLDAP